MVGEGRRDLRRHTRKGALKKSHAAGKKGGCAVVALAGMGAASAFLVGAGYILAELISRVG